MKTIKPPYQITKQITLASVIINTALGVGKILVGMVGHSAALVADGVHSISDLLTDFFVLFAAKAGSQMPDEDHPYGHGRIETFFVIVLSLFLMIVGVGIAADAGIKIWHHEFSETPHAIVLWAATLSIAINEGLFRWMKHAGEKIKSNLLIANGWHHRSDAYSSLIVLIGAGGSVLGAHFLDAIAAIIVSILIIKMAVDLGWHSVLELIDTGLSQKKINAILKLAKQVHGVKAVHQLRSRTLAGQYFIDIHVEVAGRISVSEGHYIADQVYRQLTSAFPEIKDVIVHVDPEDDEKINFCPLLPDRQEITNLLAERWQNLPGANKILEIRLDYLNAKLYIEAFLPLSVLDNSTQSASTLQQAYAKRVADMDFISRITLFFGDPS